MSVPIRITYDAIADAAYIKLDDEWTAFTVQATDDINLDFGRAGHLVGIELLRGDLLTPELLAVAERI